MRSDSPIISGLARLAKMVKRKIKLTITTASRQTIKRQTFVRLNCPVCESDVEMLTRTQAAEILEVDLRTFDHLVASGSLHTVQTASGGIRVCKNSLFHNLR